MRGTPPGERKGESPSTEGLLRERHTPRRPVYQTDGRDNIPKARNGAQLDPFRGPQFPSLHPKVRPNLVGPYRMSLRLSSLEREIVPTRVGEILRGSKISVENCGRQRLETRFEREICRISFYLRKNNCSLRECRQRDQS